MNNIIFSTVRLAGLCLLFLTIGFYAGTNLTPNCVEAQTCYAVGKGRVTGGGWRVKNSYATTTHDCWGDAECAWEVECHNGSTRILGSHAEDKYGTRTNYYWGYLCIR